MFTGLFVDALIVSPYLMRSDAELNWSSAAPAPSYTPNVLSELTFRDLESRGAGLRLAYLKVLSTNWAVYAEGDYADSSIDSGWVQDSDYTGNNRTGENSRDYAEVNDDRDRRMALTLGLKTRWLGVDGHYLTALVGRHEDELDLTLTNGVKYLPSSQRGQRLEGLNSTYNSQFNAWSAGLMTEHVFRWGTIGLRYEFHRIEFDSDANWNLRQDLAQPRSFKHSGDGYGSAITAGYGYQITPNWHFQVDYTHRDYEIEDGYHRVFGSDGGSTTTRLNEVEFDASSWRIGVSYVLGR